MNDPGDRLYLWIRAVGAIVLLIAVVVIGLALVFIPLFNHEYEADSGALVAVVGTMAASALALVGVTLGLRNGNGKK